MMKVFEIAKVLSVDFVNLYAFDQRFDWYCVEKLFPQILYNKIGTQNLLINVRS